jgi:hypothetical protein
MARTVEVFRKNGLEVERLRTEQHEAEKGNAEQRRADKYKLADKFEGAVGEIIETVFSASTELEASAETLTTGSHHYGCGCFRRGFHQRAVGGVGD